MGEITTQEYDDVVTCLNDKTGETFDVWIIEWSNDSISSDEICATITQSQEEEAIEREEEERQIQEMILDWDFKG